VSTPERGPDRVTIGKIAREAGVLPSTVRSIAQERLLPAVDRTPGGFFLFERGPTLKRLARIQALKQARLTIAEIREQLLKETEH
jgi:DNA-binding transcriptional MerR regulator